MSVPLPAPEGPVTTKTGVPGMAPGNLVTRNRGLPIEEGDELGALALGEPADGLRLADPAAVEQARGLHSTELRHRHQHVEDLRGLHPLGRVEEDLLDLDAPVLE